MGRRQPNKHQRSLWGIFALPLLVALASLLGLVAALLGNGLFDVVSWLGLGVPVVLTVWAWRRRGV